MGALKINSILKYHYCYLTLREGKTIFDYLDIKDMDNFIDIGLEQLKSSEAKIKYFVTVKDIKGVLTSYEPENLRILYKNKLNKE